MLKIQFMLSMIKQTIIVSQQQHVHYWYVRPSVDDDNKTVRFVKVVKQLNNTINSINKLQQMDL